MPASTSSNTKVGTGEAPERATSIARLMRDNSPPDATSQRTEGLARIEPDLKLDALQTRRVRTFARFRLEVHLKQAVGHSKLAELR